MNSRRFLRDAVLVPVCALILACAGRPAPVSASGFSATTERLSVRPDSTFTIPISVDPENEAHYTVGLALSFPPRALEVVSFAFDPAWMPLLQPGHDLTDNARGLLIKTAGFPKGFASPRTFGIVTFRAKREGNAEITVDSLAFILNAAGDDTLALRPRVRVTVAEEAEIQVLPVPAVLEPSGQPNLFDVISEPVRSPSPRRIATYGLMGTLGLALAAVILAGATHLRRWRLKRRLQQGANRPPQTQL